MPQTDFYQIDKLRFREQPLLLVCELARKAYQAQIPTLILSAHWTRPKAVDDLLGHSTRMPSFRIRSPATMKTWRHRHSDRCRQTPDRPMLINLHARNAPKASSSRWRRSPPTLT